MKYDDVYLYSRDIDWFCVKDGVRIHVASAGGLIPNSVNDSLRLKQTQQTVASLKQSYDESQIVFNNRFLQQRFGDDYVAIRNYCWSFFMMAAKGFISLDRTNVMNKKDQTYHFVCAAKPILDSLLEGESIILQDFHLLQEDDEYGMNITIDSIMNHSNPFVYLDTVNR